MLFRSFFDFAIDLSHVSNALVAQHILLLSVSISSLQIEAGPFASVSVYLKSDLLPRLLRALGRRDLVQEPNSGL